MNRLYWFSMLLVLIIAFILSLDGATRYTIRRDELTTLGHIGALQKDSSGVTITHTVESLAQHSADHAPLFYILLNEWGELVDFHYFALRMVSIWFGLIAIAGTYWVGRQLGNHLIGLLGALLFATNAVFYSNVHEIREWTMLTMIIILTWGYYWYLINKTIRIKWYQYLILFTLTVVGLYTNYLSIILWIAIGIYHLLEVPKTPKWWGVSLTVAIGGITFVPWLPVFIRGLGFAQSHIDRENPKLINTLELIELSSSFWSNGMAVLFVLGIGISIYYSWKNWQSARLIVFFLVMMLGSVIIINEIFPFLKRMRYLLFLVMPFCLFISYGLVQLSKIRIFRLLPVIVAVVWIFMGYQYTYSDTFNFYTTKDRTLKYTEYNQLIPLLNYLDASKDLFIQTNYEYSALRPSKQGLKSINDYYLDDLPMTWVNFPQYIEWQDSGIDMTPLEYATSLLPQYGRFWLNYHEDRVTEDVQIFMDIVEQDYGVCLRIEYGKRSVLIRYVLDNERFTERCITELP